MLASLDARGLHVDGGDFEPLVDRLSNCVSGGTPGGILHRPNRKEELYVLAAVQDCCVVEKFQGGVHK